ncbi:HNH endonuclease [Streptomyces sp. ASQP_92]|uniref:HNH endonuclease n=1 Tax=Streptomyces sp. ASQP_92 TaxID=2979116 RepID=UPI0021C0E736|nr:HNH endonuclease [Streptomyces sp. ASQP_92]MCT9092959.1 HNH endonuclease [Streptomyces sp. ASQP_92]
MTDGVTLYGPIGKLARELSPSDVLGAEEVYAAAIALWSTAIAPRLEIQSYLPGLRPPLVWTAFVGDSTTPGAPLERTVVEALRINDRFAFIEGGYGVDRVTQLFQAVDAARRTATAGSVLPSTWLNGSPFHWTRGGKCRLQDDLDYALRVAWDGSNFLGGRPLKQKRRPGQEELDRIPPMVGVLWGVSKTAWNQRPQTPGCDAFYSRFLPFKVRRTDPFPLGVPEDPPVALTDAYAWVVDSPRLVELSGGAAEKWGAVRSLQWELEGVPAPQQDAFSLRVGEHTLRIAAALAAAEESAVIHHDMIEAAWTLTRRSILDSWELDAADTSRLMEPFAKVDAALQAAEDADRAPIRTVWSEPSGRSDQEADTEPAGEPEADVPDMPVQRRTAVVQSQDRDTRVTRRVKKWYDNICQMCSTRIELPAPPYLYSEAAHIQALGAPHDGPDRIENVLCLCPNCHIQFDRGARYLTDDLHVVDALTGHSLGPLKIHPDHLIKLTYVQQHRARWKEPPT